MSKCMFPSSRGGAPSSQLKRGYQVIKVALVAPLLFGSRSTNENGYYYYYVHFLYYVDIWSRWLRSSSKQRSSYVRSRNSVQFPNLLQKYYKGPPSII